MGQKPQNNRNRDPLCEQPPSLDFLKAAAVCFLLFLAVLLVFGQAVNHEFIVCDDEPYVYGNPHVVNGLTWKEVRWSITGDYAGNWHPLTWMSHMLDVQLWGFNRTGPPWTGIEAGEHHLASVLLHAAAAVMLFLAMWRLTGAFWCRRCGGDLALHPLRAESVAWAAERKES